MEPLRFSVFLRTVYFQSVWSLMTLLFWKTNKGMGLYTSEEIIMNTSGKRWTVGPGWFTQLI